ncbi:MAG: hypothetical protein N2067_04285 [Spirochaetaceae bacterium]|nr:hypothetical protein [Spirochaetaceae bacterium]
MGMILAFSIGLVACTSGQPGSSHLLFSLGYGNTDLAFSPPSGPSTGFGLAVQRGMITVFSRKDRKLVRYSAYGEPLFMLYDPAGGAVPQLLGLRLSAGDNGTETARSQGRAAVQTSFVDPWPWAIASDQTVYIADILGNGSSQLAPRPGARHMIRKFDSQGTEEDPIGADGQGGSALKPIQGLEALAQGLLAVTTSEEAGIRISLYDRNGALTSSLVLDYRNLPVPLAVTKALQNRDHLMVVPDIESILQGTLKGEPVAILHVQYHLAAQPAGTEGTSDILETHSWLLIANLANGSIRAAFPFEDPKTRRKIPQLVGLSEGSVVGILWDDEGAGGTACLFDALQGRIMRRIRFDPGHGTSLLSIKVADDGRLYLLAAASDRMSIHAWRLTGR